MSLDPNFRNVGRRIQKRKIDRDRTRLGLKQSRTSKEEYILSKSELDATCRTLSVRDRSFDSWFWIFYTNRIFVTVPKVQSGQSCKHCKYILCNSWHCDFALSGNCIKALEGKSDPRQSVCSLWPAGLVCSFGLWFAWQSSFCDREIKVFTIANHYVLIWSPIGQVDLLWQFVW